MAFCLAAFKCFAVTESFKINIHNVPVLSRSVFQYCSRLNSVTLPSTLTEIWDNAFEQCTGLTEITIPEGVDYIGSKVFAGCENLRSVELPNSLDRACPSDSILRSLTCFA